MTALTLIDPAGEVIVAVDAHALLHAAGIPDVRSAEASELAPVMEKLRELRGIVSEAEGLASDRVVELMDLGASWTLRVDGFVLKSSSPAAGTVAYDEEKLRVVLDGLVAEGTISREAAAGALECVEPLASVPYGLLWDVLDALRGILGTPGNGDIADVVQAILAGEPEPSFRVRRSGINALRKLGPVVADALRECEVCVEPPRRRAKVTPAMSTSRRKGSS